MPQKTKTQFPIALIQFFLLAIILLIGVYFRFAGINWDENNHLHPDERFLTMVESSISPVKSINEYFDAQQSTLNPHNSGYSFFVYGTLPIFIVRYVAGWLGQANYGHVFIVGRYLSGFVDLLSVVFIFLIAIKLYRNKWIGLIAAGLASTSVLSIQLSHFFIVDSFTNFFTVAAIYFAVCVLKSNTDQMTKKSSQIKSDQNLFTQWTGFSNYLLFGVALGLAATSKINSIVAAALLPIAAFLNKPSVFYKHRDGQWQLILRNLILAAAISFLVFRIFQPYAFSGPGFFNISLNPKWVENLKELNYLSSGDSNFPPSLQWARRPIWFGLENMMLWGLGLPFGIMAIVSVIWMGIKIIKGDWHSNSLIWIWTGLYFAWQSLRWNPTMRYFLPIYPTLAIITAWGLFQIWELSKSNLESWKIKVNWKLLSAILLIITLLSSLLWAFAFTRIYTRPVTRVEASDWIYRNVESAINLSGTDNNGEAINLPIAYPHFYLLDSFNPLVIKFVPGDSGTLIGITVDHIVDPVNNSQAKRITYTVTESDLNEIILTSGQLSDSFIISDDPRGNAYQFQFEQPIVVEKNNAYFLHIRVEGGQDRVRFAGKISANLETSKGIVSQPIFLSAPLLNSGVVNLIPFTPFTNAVVEKVQLFRAIDWIGFSNNKKLKIGISDASGDQNTLTTAVINSQFISHKDFRGSGYQAFLQSPLKLSKGHAYNLSLQIIDGEGALAFYGSQQANETSWDDAIPLAMFGNNPFDYQSGLYQSDLNFELYWDDNQQKLERLEFILDQADYIYITSNRQWGSTTQIPERYPLTGTYYKNLLGCPNDNEIQWCYRVAQPGSFQGKLGFDLVKVFQSDPNLGSLRINTQFAEEAFTVYDHPKVMIFKKTDTYSSENVHSIFSKVDLSKVVNLTPAQANQIPCTLTLPDSIKAKQYTGGTWSDLFDRDSLINKNQVIGAVVWYLAISILGWIVYPTVRIALNGLRDKGYPITKLAGLLLLALPVWLAGSYGIEFNKTTISLVIAFLLITNFWLFLKQKKEIKEELRDDYRYYLKTEIIALLFFLLFLTIRIGNPDLWHPYKGGEKPMDFSYFNAVLKSSVFPPYDPWYAGGYINYYYYGFVVAGVLVKWLGLVPSIAYNLILPTFFSLTAIGAYCIGWNLWKIFPELNLAKQKQKLDGWKNWLLGFIGNPFVAGIVTAKIFLILGNLGTVRMIIHGFQRIAAAGTPIETGSFLQRAIWSIQGVIQFLGGSRFNYYPGDWYWIPSRAIPGEPITEFPFFTFLYADPHAHLFALSITLLAIVWGLSVLLSTKGWFEKQNVFQSILTLLFGAIVVGALRTTNTWDYPTFLGICVLSLLYSLIRSGNYINGYFEFLTRQWRVVISSFLTAIFFIILTFLIYQPFSQWYGQAYTAIELWEGSHTPLASYLTHWGFFLFITISRWIWEIRNWMAMTPVSAIKKYLVFKNYFIAAFLVIILIILLMLINGVQIAWLVIPLIIIGVTLFFRRDQHDIMRLLTFLSLIGLGLTFVVELVVLKGDIGRMNTVFKFYLQAWTLLSITSATYLFLIIRAVILEWNKKWQVSWLAVLILLLISVSLFPIMATVDKVSDRMSHEAPITLDGMTFMQTARYTEGDTPMNLNQDYRGILWMQENIIGSPVIVEVNVPEYRWGNRFTIYTGLPGVIGWNWHQRQQRAILPPNWVTDRIDEIQQFYLTDDLHITKNFIQKYQVKYIVVGQLENIVYPGFGLDKFKEMDGELWDVVYKDRDTIIYQVKNIS